MASYTLRVNDELDEEIQDFMSDSDVNQSEDLRKLIRRGLEHDSLHARKEELRKQLQQANNKNTKIDEIAEYREEEKSIQRIQNDRERMRSEATLIQRTKWWFTGMPSVEDEPQESDT